MADNEARDRWFQVVRLLTTGPSPWFRPGPELAAALVREAEAEISAGHELTGRALSAVAQCADCDDVIFRLDDGTFAVVHLTWAQHPEPHPWPVTQRFGGYVALEAAINNHQH